MGIIQNPASTALVEEQNSYTTYTKTDVLQDWDLAPRLICTSISEGRGLVHSTASFQFIAEDMDDEDGLNNMRTEFAMASGLILQENKYVYRTRFVLVVEELPGDDEIKFMGCLTNVPFSSKSGEGGKYDSIGKYTAMGVDWMLGQVHLVGGYFMGIDDEGADVEKHTSNIPPTFNIGGQGNKSLENNYDIEEVGIQTGIFNYSNDKYTSQESDDFNNARWTVDLATKYILYQLAYNIPKDYFEENFDCYEFYRQMFISQDSLIFPAGADDQVFNTQAQFMNDVPVSTIPVWDLMVRLVEGSGQSTLTIQYERDGGDPYAKIMVVN